MSTESFPEAHNSPELDPQLLRAELDACRSHIESLRLSIDELTDSRDHLVDALHEIQRSTAQPKRLRAMAAAALRREGAR